MNNSLNAVDDKVMTTSQLAVDNLITAIHGGWKFDQQVAQSFDEHVVKSVPFYEEIQRMVVEMSEWFVEDDGVIYDIGSATGKTISLLFEHHRDKRNIKYYGLEKSEPMVESARARCNFPNVHFFNQDVINETCMKNASFITSILTIQFLPLDQRLEILQRIYNGLKEGGAFILVEKVRAENSFSENLWLELYWDYKQRQGLTDSMILQKSRSLRGVLNPLTMGQNLKLLNEVGFANTEIFFKWYNFVGMIAVKSSLIQ